MTNYYMRAGGALCEAWTLEELAELVECALDAGDEIELLRARGTGLPRLLTREEFARLLARLTATEREEGSPQAISTADPWGLDLVPGRDATNPPIGRVWSGSEGLVARVQGEELIADDTDELRDWLAERGYAIDEQSLAEIARLAL